MNNHTNEDRELIRLNKLEVVLGIIVALVSLASLVGAWFVLPYRVGQLEDQVRGVNSRIELQKVTTDANRDLLIRMDERLKQVQRALKIPTDTP